MILNKTLVLCSASAAILALAGSPAWAQIAPGTAPVQAQDAPNDPEAAAPQQDDAVEGEDDATEVEAVVVTGLRRSLQSAQSIRRNSDQIVDAIVAEDIGKLPDVTASDSLARVTGVQVERGGGEAGRVLVRGLPDITTTYNGREIFTAEARFVAVQDFPAGGVAALEVFKSSTPNLIEPGIAGLINVRGRRPFDFNERHIGGSLRYTYANQSQEYDPNGNLLLSDRWDTGAGEIGALLNVSYTQLRFLDSARFDAGNIATTRAAAQGGQVSDPALVGARYPGGVGIFQGQGDRSRPSVNAAVQWRPNGNLEVYADALYQGFRNEGADRLMFVPIGGTFTNVVLRPDANQAGQREIQSLTGVGGGNIFHFQGAANGETDTYQFGVGAIYNAGPWRISTDIAYTDSVFDLSIYSFDYGSNRAPTVDVNFDVPREEGGVEFNFRNFDTTNPANYVFLGLFDRHLVAAGDSIQWRGDTEYETGLAKIPEIQFGLRYSDRNGSFENGERFGSRNNGVPLTQAPVDLQLSPGGFRGSDVQPLNTWVIPSRESLRANIAQLRQFSGLAEGRPPANPVQAFEANEKSYAAYGQLNYEFNGRVPVDGVVGLRVVKTEISVTGTSRSIVNGAETFTPRTEESEYTDYLPSVSARFRFTDAVQGRLAANRTRTRPDFNQVNPALTVDPNIDPATGRRGARGGNINLQPIESSNYDAALEFYFSPTGSATFTVFRRDVEGFIANQQVDVTDPVFGEIRINRPQNLRATTLEGSEAQFTTFFDFDFVPLWARNFGVQANATYISANLPGISERAYNLVGMYEQGPVSARLAYNTRSEFTTPEPGLVTEEVSRLDFSTSYTPFENITITFDASNILGEPFRNTFDYGPGIYPRDVRFEETIYSLGVRFRL